MKLLILLITCIITIVNALNNSTNTTNTTVAPYNPYANPYTIPTTYNNSCAPFNLIGGICNNTTMLHNGYDTTTGTYLAYPLPWNWPTYVDDNGDNQGNIYDTNICHIHFVCNSVSCDNTYISDPCNPSGGTSLPTTEALIAQYFNYTNLITLSSNTPSVYNLSSWCNFPNTFVSNVNNAWGSQSYKVHKGSTSPPIGVVIGTGQRQILKSMYYPTVDTMSLLQLERSTPFGNSTSIAQQNFSLYSDWHWDAAVSIVLEVNAGDPANSSATIRSTPVRRFGVYNPLESSMVTNAQQQFIPMIVPFWTAIITVADGIVQSIDWDTDCSLCSTAYCLDGVCAIDPSQCSVFGGTTDCDVKIYVAWGGSDSSQTPLQSTNMRLSQFRRWSFAGAFNAASNWYTNSLPTLPQDGNIANRPVTVSGT